MFFLPLLLLFALSPLLILCPDIQTIQSDNGIYDSSIHRINL
jgi:hypothetical protein